MNDDDDDDERKQTTLPAAWLRRAWRVVVDFASVLMIAVVLGVWSWLLLGQSQPEAQAEEAGPQVVSGEWGICLYTDEEIKCYLTEKDKDQ